MQIADCTEVTCLEKQLHDFLEFFILLKQLTPRCVCSAFGNVYFCLPWPQVTEQGSQVPQGPHLQKYCFNSMMTMLKTMAMAMMTMGPTCSREGIPLHCSPSPPHLLMHHSLHHPVVLFASAPEQV